jgi:hypothetical protein
LFFLVWLPNSGCKARILLYHQFCTGAHEVFPWEFFFLGIWSSVNYWGENFNFLLLFLKNCWSGILCFDCSVRALRSAVWCNFFSCYCSNSFSISFTKACAWQVISCISITVEVTVSVWQLDFVRGLETWHCCKTKRSNVLCELIFVNKFSHEGH